MSKKNIVLTGATGGIGRPLLAQLSGAGHQVVIIGRKQNELSALSQPFENVSFITADLNEIGTSETIFELAASQLGHVDVLINLAGTQLFAGIEDQDSEAIERQFKVNVLAPIYLSQAAVRHMKPRKSGHIIMVGSTFGAIGFAYFSTYSATKFALRGFAEALRRELQGCVNVSYIAPRSVDTEMNDEAVKQLAQETDMNVDTPQYVASEIAKLVAKPKAQTYLGFPEKLFARINGAFPNIIDTGLKKSIAASARICAAQAKH